MTEEEYKILFVQAKEAEFVVGKTAEVLTLKEKVKTANSLRRKIVFWTNRVIQTTRQLNVCKYPWAITKWEEKLETHRTELNKAKEAFKNFE